MKNSPFKIIWLKAAIAFLIPFLVALGASLSPYVNGDTAQPTFIGWLVIIIAPLVAGLSCPWIIQTTKMSRTHLIHLPPLSRPWLRWN